jgi:hypothetical protein
MAADAAETFNLALAAAVLDQAEVYTNRGRSILQTSSVRAARRSLALLWPCKPLRTGSERSMTGSICIWPTKFRFRSWPTRPG